MEAFSSRLLVTTLLLMVLNIINVSCDSSLDTVGSEDKEVKSQEQGTVESEDKEVKSQEQGTVESEDKDVKSQEQPSGNESPPSEKDTSREISQISGEEATVEPISNSDPQEDLKEILRSGALPELDKIWQKYKLPYETLIAQSLKETFGKGSLNLFARVHGDSTKLADGFHAFDNAVDIIFSEMRLLDIPTVDTAQHSLSLVYGSYFLSAVLSRIHVFTRYHLYKANHTTEYLSQNQDPTQKSPFTFQQVQDNGDLTDTLIVEMGVGVITKIACDHRILADRCKLSGHAVLSLVGSTVSLGHNSLRLIDCEFSVEISTPGLGSPPVFAPYFVRDQAKALMRIISKPLREITGVRLQNIFFSVINVTNIFGDDADRLRNTMQAVSKKSADYFDNVLKALNRQRFEHAKSLVPVDNFQMDFQKEINGKIENFQISITDVSISGLESAYSSRSGGIFIARETANLAEAISFSNLQVRGRYGLIMQNAMMGRRIISVDVRDATAHVELELFDGAKLGQKLKLHKPPMKHQPRVDQINFSGWSQLEVALFDSKLEESLRQHLLSTISGYVTYILPTHVERYLTTGLQAAINYVDTYLERLQKMIDEGSPIAKSQVPIKLYGETTSNSEEQGSSGEQSGSEDTQSGTVSSSENKISGSGSNENTVCDSGSEESKGSGSGSSNNGGEDSGSGKNTKNGSGSESVSSDENKISGSESTENKEVSGSNSASNEGSESDSDGRRSAHQNQEVKFGSRMDKNISNEIRNT